EWRAGSHAATVGGFHGEGAENQGQGEGGDVLSGGGAGGGDGNPDPDDGLYHPEISRVVRWDEYEDAGIHGVRAEVKPGAEDAFAVDGRGRSGVGGGVFAGDSHEGGAAGVGSIPVEGAGVRADFPQAGHFAVRADIGNVDCERRADFAGVEYRQGDDGERGGERSGAVGARQREGGGHDRGAVKGVAGVPGDGGGDGGYRRADGGIAGHADEGGG